MRLGAIHRISERSLKWLCIIFGIFFLGVALHVWLDGEIQKNNAEALVLVPLLSGLVLLAAALLLRVEALRVLVLCWFMGLPAAFYALDLVGCGFSLLPESWCR
jgi:predicted permease